MAKEFKTIDEQIELLQVQKHIEVTDVEKARQILLDNNYYNVISCSKIKYILTLTENKHNYETSNFDEWLEYYEKDVEVSQYLMAAMNEFEKNLNSRTAYYISEIIERNEQIEQSIKEDLARIITKSKVNGLERYCGVETWKYITKMEFGKMKQLIFYLFNHKDIPELSSYLDLILKDTDLQIGRLKNQIDDLNNLRNHLFHFTPLNIYISYGLTGKKNKRLSNTRRKKAVSFIFNMKPNSQIKSYLSEFYNASDRFVKIKNSQLES